MSESNINFIDTDAEAIYTEIITALEGNVGEPLYPGDERRIYGEAIVAAYVMLFNRMNDTARQSLLRYARGTVLDALGERIGTARLASKQASVTMRFYLSAPLTTNTIIPLGTRVTGDGVHYFLTSTAGVIQAGQTSTDIMAVAENAGTEYNSFQPGTIMTLVDLVPYVESVTNTTTSRNGDDGEPYTEDGDDRYRERIRLAPNKLSTAGPAAAYEYWAMTADSDISDVRAVSPSPGEVTIIPLMKGGEIPDAETLAAILEVVGADNIRPLTDKVTVEAPTVVEYDIQLKYYAPASYEAEVISNVEGTGGAIEKYNDWQMEQIGRNVNPDQLRKLILAPDWVDGLVGATRVDLVKPIYADIGDTQVAKWSGGMDVTHEVIVGGV